MQEKIVYFISILFLNGVFLLNSCEKQTSCRDCILDASGCTWCASHNYSGIRCKLQTDDEGWCPDSLQNPHYPPTISGDHAFNSSTGNVCQIKPQRIKLKLRVGQPLNFSFSFKETKNYPVDLYFLLDASKGMADVKNDTVEHTEAIYQMLTEKTNDVFFGLGTFIDKNTTPYSLDIPKNLSYSFRHRLSLTKNLTEFRNVVEDTPFGENNDIPEGGLDALAQALVCKERIGWRRESRKIVVLMTDAPYHAAGDGISGALFQPYDGECYTFDGIYTKELEMDYPSVGMINKLARENEIIIIFAVTLDYYAPVYQSLAAAISGSKMASLGTSNSNNIVVMLDNIYEEITTNIKLKVKNPKKNFDITFDPDCTQENNIECSTSSREEHKFNGVIKLLKYDGTDKTSIDIVVEGINEKLTLDIDVIKDCDCESPSKVENPSEYCNGDVRECGICKCSAQKYGANCACSHTTKSKTNHDSTCNTDGMENPCNGAGTCSCGECHCFPGFTGPYCECNLNSCPLHKGVVCGGHGDCLCNKTCDCHPGWTDDACGCSKDVEHCKANNDKVCNERGNCHCGECECNPIGNNSWDNTNNWDKRRDQDKFCVVNPCPDCHDLQCTRLNECALCLVKNDTDCPCSFSRYEIVDSLPEDVLNGTDWNVCSNVWVDVGCYTSYAYQYDEEQYRILLMLQWKKDCAESYYIYGGISLASVLLIGLLTVIAWKLFTEARDRQEYLRFVNTHHDSIAEPCANPLFRPASTMFNNPAFRKRSIY